MDFGGVRAETLLHGSYADYIKEYSTRSSSSHKVIDVCSASSSWLHMPGPSVVFLCPAYHSLVTSLRVPPGEKQSGEQSRISWAYYSKAVRTNEIARSVVIT